MPPSKRRLLVVALCAVLVVSLVPGVAAAQSGVGGLVSGLYTRRRRLSTPPETTTEQTPAD